MNKQAQEGKRSVETNKRFEEGYHWRDVNEPHFSYLENEVIVLGDFWSFFSHVRDLRLGHVNQSQWREDIWDQHQQKLRESRLHKA